MKGRAYMVDLLVNNREISEIGVMEIGVRVIGAPQK